MLAFRFSPVVLASFAAAASTFLSIQPSFAQTSTTMAPPVVIAWTSSVHATQYPNEPVTVSVAWL